MRRSLIVVASAYRPRRLLVSRGPRRCAVWTRDKTSPPRLGGEVSGGTGRAADVDASRTRPGKKVVLGASILRYGSGTSALPSDHPVPPPGVRERGTGRAGIACGGAPARTLPSPPWRSVQNWPRAFVSCARCAHLGKSPKERAADFGAGDPRAVHPVRIGGTDREDAPSGEDAGCTYRYMPSTSARVGYAYVVKGRRPARSRSVGVAPHLARILHGFNDPE